MAPQSIHPDDRRLWRDELVNIERDVSDYHVSPGYHPEIRFLTMEQPLIWLRKGWQDLARNPVVAIAYGALIAVLYAAIVLFALSTQFYHVGVQLTAGFILLAPMMALGFYGISRQVERGKAVSIMDALRAWRQNDSGLLGMGLLMVLLFLTWFMVSMWATAFLSGGQEGLAQLFSAETLSGFFGALFASLTLPMVLGYFLIGLAAVLVAFALSAVSIPMLMDKPDSDAITALTVSWEAVVHNWKPMLLWAVLIALFTGIGLAFFYVGLAITMPLLGFATWHAYRDTLGEWRKVEEPAPPYY